MNNDDEFDYLRERFADEIKADLMERAYWRAVFKSPWDRSEKDEQAIADHDAERTV